MVIVPFILFTLIWSSTWFVIRYQLGVVPAQWSVTYRFLIAGAAMAVTARVQGHSLRADAGLLRAALLIGLMQFCVNFNAVYLAERRITSGLVATVFALLLIPNSLLAWAWLGHRVSGRFIAGGAVAVAGIALLFVHEAQDHPAFGAEIVVGILLTVAGLIGASVSNVYQALERVRRYPISVLLAWSMAVGTVIDAGVAWPLTGPPRFDPRPEYWLGLLYLALVASVLGVQPLFPGGAADRAGQGGMVERADADHRDGAVDRVRRLSLVIAGGGGGVAGDGRDGGRTGRASKAGRLIDRPATVAAEHRQP